MKRSVNSEQTLMMNASDFQRAAGGRKIKYSFSIAIHRGRLQTMDNPPAIAKEFVSVLQQDPITNQVIRQYDFEFALNNNFQLSIKNSTPPVESNASEPEEDESKEE